MAVQRAPTECPACGQPLLDRAALERLQQREREQRERLTQEARTLARQMAADEIAKARESEARKVERKLASQTRSLNQAIVALHQQNEALQRRIERLTAAERGEFSEVDLVRELKQAFPDDVIERRGRGGDVLHEVYCRSGGQRVRAGLLVYECKDTVQWAASFLDQAAHAAQLHRTPHVVIVTKSFPRNERNLAMRDGVAIVHPSGAVALAHVIRRMIVEVHRSGLTAQGQAEKTAILYQYLASSDFREDFDAVLDVGQQLKHLLAKERLAHHRTWAEREEAYNELADKASAIDGRIRMILERPAGAARDNVVALPVR